MLPLDILVHHLRQGSTSVSNLTKVRKNEKVVNTYERNELYESKVGVRFYFPTFPQLPIESDSNHVHRKHFWVNVFALSGATRRGETVERPTPGVFLYLPMCGEGITERLHNCH